MQYMGGKSRIAGAIANIINEIPRRKVQNSGPDCLRHICNGGGDNALSVCFAVPALLKARSSALIEKS